MSDSGWKDHYRRINASSDRSKATWQVVGFENLEEAKEYATTWAGWAGWGYSPSANAIEIDGQIVVYCSKYNSCD